MQQRRRPDGRFVSRRALAAQLFNADSQLDMLNRNLAGLIARIIYLYYCACLNSSSIAIETQLKAPAIRQILWRLHRTWARLAAEAGSPAVLARAEPGVGAMTPAEAPEAHIAARGAI